MSKLEQERQMHLIKSKEFLPRATVFFLEKTFNLPSPSIRKKLYYEYDALQHKGGKPILKSYELYQYENLNKVQERLKQILELKFPKNLVHDDFVKNIQLVKSNIAKNKSFAKILLHAYLVEDEAFYQEQAEISSVHSFMCYFIAYFAFLPFFMHTVAQISQVYDEEAWTHGHCPYCGSPALMSYLKGKEGRRINTCSRCLAFYRVPRIQCPYCLETKQKKLSIFTSNTDAEVQICTCSNCKTYIKLKDYKEYEKFEPNPLLDDFKSITLDIVAENQKYFKGAISLWLI